MGHRYYIWAKQCYANTPFTLQELLNAINRIAPTLMSAESNFMFVTASKINENTLKIVAAYKKMIPVRIFNETTKQFFQERVADWKDANAYWYLDENIIEIRGSNEIAEKFINELNSLLGAYFDFSPMLISKTAFNFIMKKRVQKITVKSFDLENGLILIKGKEYIYLADTKDMRELLSKKDVSSTIRGVYYLPSNLETAFHPIPVIINQQGKIQFIKVELKEAGMKKETYERITNAIVKDILQIVERYPN